MRPNHERSNDPLITFNVLITASMRILWPTLAFPISFFDGNTTETGRSAAFQEIYQQTIHYPSMSYEEFYHSCQAHHRCVGVTDVQIFCAQIVRLLNSLFAADIVPTANDNIASILRHLLEGWVDVVVRIGPGDEGLKAVLDELRQTFGTCFIKWVEAMTLLGWVAGKIVNQLNRIFHWLQVCIMSRMND